MENNLSACPLTGVLFRGGFPVGTPRKDGYLVVWWQGKLHLAHRVVWFLSTGRWPEGQLDHVNGVRSDNRMGNLRLVTNRGNQEARHTAVAASGLIGVYRRKDTGKYTSKIKTNGRSINLGCFDTPGEARAAYLAAKAQHHSVLPGWRDDLVVADGE